MPLPAPLASGRTADVYALDGAQVLRRYRAGGDVRAEAQVMRHLHARGYPVPKVHHADGRDLVLDRLSGPTLAEAVVGASSMSGTPPTSWRTCTSGCTRCPPPGRPIRRPGSSTSTCIRRTSSSPRPARW
ncbi:phosphotransferase [Micromonospora globispora]|uniref:phosphotransferase n=1 Tax=Micromonospora globispora TaxID=1450148 RepID=UPI001C897945|nr:phosphotransferase [Micromonospora globispora]